MLDIKVSYSPADITRAQLTGMAGTALHWTDLTVQHSNMISPEGEGRAVPALILYSGY